MAQSDSSQEIVLPKGRNLFCAGPLPSGAAFTGGDDARRFLLPQLHQSFASADQIDLIVSFLMGSGVRLILEDLKKAAHRGAKIRILTGNYLGITQPEALYILRRELRDLADLRLYPASKRSFHAKSYIFHHKDTTEVYVGSSNLSASALTSGIEWNYRFDSSQDPDSVQHFISTFEDLFANHSVILDDERLAQYAANWHKPAVLDDLYRQESRTRAEGADAPASKESVEPNGVQTEALYALEQSRSEGATKGLVHAATGIGKTYLAAFDSVGFSRVLFVAHREEILRQASDAFSRVRPDDTRGFFMGSEKTTDTDIVFASVATIGRPNYLNDRYFSPDAFDYIVIDEFHHAAASQYKRVLDYFRPKFLLGLTATPERLDGRNIYELCDYNVPFELSLQSAINRGVLVPFHYYGIYDDTDYSSVRMTHGHYDETELTKVYSADTRRSDLIFDHFRKHSSRRALGFCCSRDHAEMMARDFTERGVSSAAVYSGADGGFSIARSEAVRRLQNGELQVVFCVDMFNEGVDVPELDMVMFLRPTESPVIFLQQLGRGLRRSPDTEKEWLTVLDFIGNYEKAAETPHLLSGQPHPGSGGEGGRRSPYPDDCIVDFDLRLLNLFRHLERRSQSIRKCIEDAYRNVAMRLDRRPSRVDLFTYMDGAIYDDCLKRSRENPFRDYLEFLYHMDALTPDEKALYDSIGRDFIRLLETTQMTRVYKMPLLYSFLDGGEIRVSPSRDDILNAWKAFFGRNRNWRDLGKNMDFEKYEVISDTAHLSNIRNNPINFLVRSGNGFFTRTDDRLIALNPKLEPILTNPALITHWYDILEYRTLDYYKKRYLSKRESLSEDAALSQF